MQGLQGCRHGGNAPGQHHGRDKLVVEKIESQLDSGLAAVLPPVSASVPCSSAMNVGVDGDGEPTARPQSAGRPAMQKLAPSASALKMSVPRRMPPSMPIGMRPLTTAATSRKTCSVAGAESNWRPPWLEMTMPSRPHLMASSASSAPETVQLSGHLFCLVRTV